MTSPEYHQRWIEINADTLANNVQVLKSIVAPANFMAVVKANAYGHGAKLIAPILRDAGADWFGVTTLDEAQQLLAAGIESIVTPILCFAPVTDSAALEWAIENSLHVTVADSSDLEYIESAEKAIEKSASVHLKIDTGMGRLGQRPDLAVETFSRRQKWAGVYTHFANGSSKSLSPTLKQLKTLNQFMNKSAKKSDFGLCHAANSAAALRIPNSRLDMVRIGTVLYGQMPSGLVPKPDGLRTDTFTLKARALQIKDLRKGDTVGYGSEFKAPRAMRVGVIPIGFADGFGVAPTSMYSGTRGLLRVLKSGNEPLKVWINDYPAPVIGRVAMQMIVVDLSQVSSTVEPGTVVDVPIRRLAASALIPRVLVRD